MQALTRQYHTIWEIYFVGGTADGTCADGYGVCCICKFMYHKYENYHSAKIGTKKR